MLTRQSAARNWKGFLYRFGAFIFTHMNLAGCAENEDYYVVAVPKQDKREVTFWKHQFKHLQIASNSTQSGDYIDFDDDVKRLLDL